MDRRVVAVTTTHITRAQGEALGLLLLGGSPDALHAALSSLAVRQGVKLGTILWPLRIALSGRAVTPGGAVELCCVLGRAESLRRICQGIAQLPPAAD